MNYTFKITQGGTTFEKSYSASSVDDAIKQMICDLAVVASISRAKGKKAPISARVPFQFTCTDESGIKVVDSALSGNLLRGTDDVDSNKLMDAITGARFVRSLSGMKRIIRDVKLSATDVSYEARFAAIEADKQARKAHKALPVAE